MREHEPTRVAAPIEEDEEVFAKTQSVTVQKKLVLTSKSGIK